MRVARPPTAPTFAAVLAAPPSTRRVELTGRTGTGASGEIRLHSPIRYSSRMASPRTSTRLFLNCETRTAAASTVSFSVIELLTNRRALARDWRRGKRHSGLTGTVTSVEDV